MKKAAYDALKAGNLENARDIFDQLSKNYPWVAAFKFNLALTCFKLGRLQEAMKNVNAGLAIEPDDEKAQSMKKTIESRQRKGDDDAGAQEGPEKPVVFDRNREDQRTTSLYHGIQGSSSHFFIRDSLANTTPSGINQPEYSHSRLMNFVVFEKQRRRLEARSLFENDIDDEPHAARVIWYFSDRDMHEFYKPIPNSTVFHPLVELKNDSFDDVMTRIEQLPTPDDAIFLDSMKTRYSYDISFIKEIINKLHKSNQYQLTIQACEKYLKHFPEDLEILFELANIYMEMGNLGQSEGIVKKIIENYYENAYAWFNLARIYEIKGLGQYEAFCLTQAKNFGYPVDEIRLARLTIRGIPVDPFTDNVKWE